MKTYGGHKSAHNHTELSNKEGQENPLKALTRRQISDEQHFRTNCRDVCSSSDPFREGFDGWKKMEKARRPKGTCPCYLVNGLNTPPEM